MLNRDRLAPLMPTLLPVAAILLMQSLALSPAHADHIDGDIRPLVQYRRHSLA